MRNKTNRPARLAGAIVMIAMLCVSLFPCSALAAGPGQIDTSKEVSLTLTGSPCAGVTYRLYHIGNVSADVQFTLTEAYAGYPVSLQQPDAAGWLDLAATLKGYIARDGMAADAIGVTDETGSVSFPTLEQGLYAIIGDTFDLGNYTFYPTPYILCLPNLQKTGDTTYSWDYDVVSIPKMRQEEHGGGGSAETISIRVLKVWSQSASTLSERPASVDVQLLKDGAVYDTQSLSADNSWRYVWNELNPECAWSVVEVESTVPGHFKTSVSGEGTDTGYTFTVTNTYEEHDEPFFPDDQGGGRPNKPSDPGDSPDSPSNPSNPGSDPDSPDNPGGNPDDPGIDLPDDPTPQGPWDNPGDPSDPGSPDDPEEVLDEEEVPTGSFPQETPENPTVLDEEEVPLASLPQTGVLWWPVPVMACAGLVLFGAGWGITGRRPEED